MNSKAMKLLAEFKRKGPAMAEHDGGVQKDKCGSKKKNGEKGSRTRVDRVKEILVDFGGGGGKQHRPGGRGGHLVPKTGRTKEKVLFEEGNRKGGF